MTTDPLSLKNLLLGGAGAPPSEGEGDSALAEVRHEVQTRVPGLRWSDASKAIDAKIDSVLERPIDGLLVAAWAKYGELRKYADLGAYPPGKRVLTSLVRHKVDASFKPSVVIQVTGIDVASLELPIVLTLELEGVTLEIEGGRILAVRAGSLGGIGTLGFRLSVLRPKLPPKDLFPPIEKRTEKVELPAAIELGEGVRIGPPGVGGPGRL